MSENIKHIIKTGITLQNEIRHLLNKSEDAQDYLIVEAVVEAIAEAGGMVAVTADDLPAKE